MAIHLSAIANAKQALKPSLSIGKEGASSVAPKGHLVVYVGEEEKRRYLVLIRYLNQPLFQDMHRRVEEEFGYDHPMGGLRTPMQCRYIH